MTYFQVTPGQVVESAHMNAAIRQGVPPFANAAARAAAIPSPVEGQVSTLNDTDVLERYDGAAWRKVTGKAVHAGSAGPSAADGTITVTYPAGTFTGVPVLTVSMVGSTVAVPLIQSSLATGFTVKIWYWTGTTWGTATGFNINYTAIQV